MKKVSKIIMTGALVLGFGAAASFAGDRTLTPQGRSGFAYRAQPQQEMTVAIYTGNRRMETRMTTDREDQRMLKFQGRQGVKYRVD